MRIDNSLDSLKEPFKGIIVWIVTKELPKYKETLNLEVFETKRSKERQKECLKKKTSKTLKSKHLLGLAVDIVYKGDKGWSWDMKRPEVKSAYLKLRDIVDKYPDLRVIPWDYPHIEYSGSMKDVRDYEEGL